MQARQGVGNAVKAIKLKVSGLVREALWAQKLALVRFEMKQKEFAYAQKLARTVQRRVEVGDLRLKSSDYHAPAMHHFPGALRKSTHNQDIFPGFASLNLANSQLVTYYKDDFAGSNLGAYEFDGSIQVPVWNWGQRDAGLQLAMQARQGVGCNSGINC
jgi:hypothetical protein